MCDVYCLVGELQHNGHALEDWCFGCSLILGHPERSCGKGPASVLYPSQEEIEGP